ncbi:MAG: hypothetical protein ACTSXJ_09100 [Candidatus Baldrarchaeia archaeon]
MRKSILLADVVEKVREAKRLEKEGRYEDAIRTALEAAEILLSYSKFADLPEKVLRELKARAWRIITWARSMRDLVQMREALHGTRAEVPKVPVARDSMIRSLYIIHNDGIPLYTYVDGSTSLSPTLVSGALTGIIELLKEITKTKVKSISHEDGIIMIEYGKFVNVVVFVREESQEIRKKMANLVREIETRYKEILENWDGNLNHFKDLENVVREVIFGE